MVATRELGEERDTTETRDIYTRDLELEDIHYKHHGVICCWLSQLPQPQFQLRLATLYFEMVWT